MASAGLLDGRRATVHWDLLDAFTEHFLDVIPEQARYLRDGPMMTCAGAMSALDLTLDLISDHLGIAARLDVEALFIHGDPPVGDNRGRRHLGDALVRRALGLMRDNLERPLPLDMAGPAFVVPASHAGPPLSRRAWGAARDGLSPSAPGLGAQAAGKHRPGHCRDRGPVRVRIPGGADTGLSPGIWQHAVGGPFVAISWKIASLSKYPL